MSPASSAQPKTGSPRKASYSGSSKWERIAIFVFSAVLIVTILVLAIAFPRPTPFQYLVFRVILAISLGGIAAFIPGFIHVTIHPVVRAGGALAVFVLVFMANPAQLITEPASPSVSAGTTSTKFSYTGRVINKTDGKPIHSAKVTLETEGAPTIAYTDSEGVYRFILELKDAQPVAARIRGEAAGYQSIDRNISISTATTLEDLRMDQIHHNEAQQQLLRQHKLAFAAGGAIAMSGHARAESGRTIFERALADLGITSSQVQDLTQQYRLLDRSIRTGQPPAYIELHAQRSRLLEAVDEQLHVISGNSIAAYVNLGYQVCQLLLLMNFWDSFGSSENLLSIARTGLISLQESLRSVDMPRNLSTEMGGLDPTAFGSVQGRLAVQEILARVVGYFDMEPSIRPNPTVE